MSESLPNIPAGSVAPEAKPMSLAAQTVLDAVFVHWPGGHNYPGKSLCVAAVCRALLDQVVPEDSSECAEFTNEAIRLNRMGIRAKSLAIAAELGGAPWLTTPLRP